MSGSGREEGGFAVNEFLEVNAILGCAPPPSRHEISLLSSRSLRSGFRPSAIRGWVWTYKLIRNDVRNGIATITLNGSDRFSALTFAMVEEVIAPLMTLTPMTMSATSS